jgi:transposase
MKKERIEVKDKNKIVGWLRGERDVGVKVRLIFLNLVGNLGMKIEEASRAVGISKRMAYDWIKWWNEEGYEGIRRDKRGGGRPPELKDEELKKLRGHLEEKDYWTTPEVREEIRNEFGVQFSESQVRRILRDKLKMKLSKPYPLDYRKPENAEDILRQELTLAMKYLKETKGLKEKEIAIGFMDETAPQLTANTVRVWSFGKPRVIKNTSKMKANTLGFYAIRGNSVQLFLEGSKKKDIAKALEEIREANREYKAILVTMDNFKSHLSCEVREKADELGITIVYLPRYSPDLNPIEFVWRSIKRVISISFVKTIEALKNLIQEKYREFSQKLSYATSWIQKFLEGDSLCNEFCN